MSPVRYIVKTAGDDFLVRKTTTSPASITWLASRLGLSPFLGPEKTVSAGSGQTSSSKVGDENGGRLWYDLMANCFIESRCQTTRKSDARKTSTVDPRDVLRRSERDYDHCKSGSGFHNWNADLKRGFCLLLLLANVFLFCWRLPFHTAKRESGTPITD